MLLLYCNHAYLRHWKRFILFCIFQTKPDFSMFKVTHHHEIRFGPLDLASKATPNFSKQGLAWVSLWPRAMLWVPCPAAQCSNLSSHRIGFSNQLQLQLQLTFSAPLTPLINEHIRQGKQIHRKKKYQTAKQPRPAVFVSWRLNKIKPKEFRMRVCTRAGRTEKSRERTTLKMTWDFSFPVPKLYICSEIFCVPVVALRSPSDESH